MGTLSASRLSRPPVKQAGMTPPEGRAHDFLLTCWYLLDHQCPRAFSAFWAEQAHRHVQGRMPCFTLCHMCSGLTEK